MEPGLLHRLETAGLQELRAEWEQRFGTALRLRSPDLLRRILAWRIQVAKQGGPDRITRRMLGGSSAAPEMLLSEGTVITREWKGVRHEVEIADGCFIYGGERWKSLSEIARAITGTRWSGPRFFGLRDGA